MITWAWRDKRLAAGTVIAAVSVFSACGSDDERGRPLQATGSTQTATGSGGHGTAGAGVGNQGGGYTSLPPCSDGIPSGFVPNTTGSNYTITLESNQLVQHTGDIRAKRYYDGEPPMIADIVITTGDYSDPQCNVGQNGHYYYWDSCNPQTGGIWNIHAVPTSTDLDDWIRHFQLWQNVTFAGFEVDKIDYSNGSWWTDSGCNTFLIYWVCENDV